MRWSRLRKLIEDLWDPDLDLQILCTSLRRPGIGDIGRYWITLEGETIWQYPADLDSALSQPVGNPEVGEVTVALREYIDTPRDALLDMRLTGDVWGLGDLLKAADRRLGRRSLENLAKMPLSVSARRILDARLGPRV